MYSLGQGLEKDEPKAAEWFLKAANQNSGVGQYTVGIIYLEGKGVERNRKKGENWLRQARATFLKEVENKKGEDAEAAGKLSHIYYRGLGVREDSVKAYKWALIACQASSSAFTPPNIQRRTSTAVRVRGRKQAQLWLAQHGKNLKVSNVPSNQNNAGSTNGKAAVGLGTLLELGLSIWLGKEIID